MDLKKASLAEKIGQMFICGFHGTEPTSEIAQLIKQHYLGGIIYFRRNIESCQQVKRLSSSLQRLSSSVSDLPLFISIDQEGGMVARIDRGITLIPGNMALGATKDFLGVYEAARISGKELRQLGINMNFAPSIDVNNNPLNPVIGVRSFGADPDFVKQMGIHAVRGYQDAGMIATVKHFPGHGDTDSDSHHTLPTIPHDLDRLQQVELVPFIGAIEEKVDVIMTAHILFPAIDSSATPATLSYQVLTGLLRESLGYQGLIVTDCLEMSAISGGVGVEEGAVLAVEAGADLLLVSHTYEHQVGAIQRLVEAVESGRISEERINQSLERILDLKNQRLMWEEANNHEPLVISSEEDRLFIESLSEKSITLVKDEGQLPLQQTKTYVIWTEVRVGTEVDEVIEQEETLGHFLKQDLSYVYEDRIGVHPTEEEIRKVLETYQQFEQVIFLSYNATFSEGQVFLVKEIAQNEGVRLIVAATRNPYDLLEFPEVKTFIACYENRPVAMNSLAKVLLGKIPAVGELPVSLT